ncbi:MAG: hypothetical protein AAF389_06730 [Gemmatimonadota bacterium]
MGFWTRVVVWGVLIGASSPTLSVEGQQRVVDPVARAVASTTGPGGRIRLTLPSGAYVVGRVAAVADSGVTIQPRIGASPRPAPAPVFVSAVETPRVEVGRAHTGRGAAWGGILGFSFGVVAALPLVDLLGSEGWFVVIPFGAATGLVGAGAGALVGSAFTRWDVVYQRR